MKKIFFTAILFIIYYITAIYNKADTDLWHRLAAGKLFFSTMSVPHKDIFSYTPIKPLWVDHEWGSGVIFYFIANHFGDAGLALLKFFLFFSVFFFVYKINKLKTNNENKDSIIFYLIFFYALIFGFLYTIRSQCFTFAFFALWLYLLELVKLGNNKLLFLFPFISVIWVNLHGGFLAGLGILFLYGLGEAFNKKNPAKYIITAGISTLAMLINPYGIELWNFLYEAVTLKRTFIGEWFPLNLFGPLMPVLGFKIFLILTLFTLPYLFLKKYKDINWAEILILTLTCYLSFKHIRHNVFFVIASASYSVSLITPAFKWYFGGFIKKIKDFISEKVILISFLFGKIVTFSFIFIVGILTLVFVPLKVKVSKDIYPVGALRFIEKNNLSGNILTPFNWGGYVLWKLYPQCLVSMDGRYEEVYPNSVVQESERFQYLGKDWGDFMEKYKADLILLDITYPVYYELLTHKDWKIIYKDKISAIFVPDISETREWIMPEKDFDPGKNKFYSKIGE